MRVHTPDVEIMSFNEIIWTLDGLNQLTSVILTFGWIRVCVFANCKLELKVTITMSVESASIWAMLLLPMICLENNKIV